MIDKILKVTAEELNEINLSKYLKSTDDLGFPKSWFYMDAGLEHYRLLAFISKLYNGVNLLDIGSYQGSSAIALSFNKKNKVISYDIDHQPEIADIKISNIEFIKGNVLKNEITAPFILLDTYHDGTFEQEFIDHLLKIKYKGLVMFDDIHLNKEMSNFWNGLKNEKYDLTEIGHHSGTGIAIF
jgi:predicted nicotinamide N-methyase